MAFKYGTIAHRLALAADEAWQSELVLCFGKNAGDMRYRIAGTGEPGTPLRAAYLARTTAQNAWHKECDS